MSIALIVSRFNHEITELLWQGAVERLHELGIKDANLQTVRVPGAVELPLAAQQFAQHEHCQAIICLGAVIRGETDHYNYVCQQVSYGCQRVALDYNIPVIFGVLTTENREQALARVGGTEGHQGRYAAEAAVEMMRLMEDYQECACET